MAPRRLFILVALLIGMQSFTLSSDDSNKIHFKEKKFSSVFKSAKKDHKLVFVLVMSRYCAVCHRMDKDLKKGGSYSQFFNDKFECYKMYADNSFAMIKAGNWGVSKVPSLVFMNEKHQVVHFAEGYTDMEGVMAEAQKAIDAADQRNLTQK